MGRLQGDDSKPVYNKIYWAVDYDDNIYDLGFKKNLENILSIVKYNIVELQSLYNESLPLIITKKIDDLIADYSLLENKIDDILYGDDHDEHESEYP